MNNTWSQESFTIATADGLNHGIAQLGKYIYASSDTTVYRFDYTEGQKTDSTSSKKVIIKNIHADGNGGAPKGHWTRTIVFDKKGRLYVAVGSNKNVDPDSYRSRIRRFASYDEGNIDFKQGEVFADGLRNEVGLAFDKEEVLWGVENSADRLQRSDLGGDIHNENPAEELNKFIDGEAQKKSYGYPYCWTEFKLDSKKGGKGRGTVWAWPSFMDTYSDEWCRKNTVPPVMALQAHSAPLGITFFKHKEWPQECTGSLPKDFDGHAFIAYHGSWNRDTPTGYKVVRIPMKDGMPSAEQPTDFMWHEGDAKFPSGIRPVDLKFDKCGRLLVTSDGTRPNGAGSGVIIIQASA